MEQRLLLHLRHLSLFYPGFFLFSVIRNHLSTPTMTPNIDSRKNIDWMKSIIIRVHLASTAFYQFYVGVDDIQQDSIVTSSFRLF